MATSVSVSGLSLDFGHARVLDKLDLAVAEGEFLVLLGPSGCGKSTLLNCIAGLLDIAEGRILIGGRDVTFEEPKDRGIGMVFQSYALYPQMSVERNLSFALRVAGMPRAEIEARVSRAAGILQIGALLKRKPGALSGGQRQRVAIGRALVRDAALYLFDEPLSNLDAQLRGELRVEIKRLHQRLKNTMIYVTHDQIEALTLADRIAVMKGGVIQQIDTPKRIYGRPVNRFVAGFIGAPGMSFLDGTVGPGRSGARFEGDDLSIPIGMYAFDGLGKRHGPAVLGIRPEHVVTGGAANSMPFSRQVPVEIVEPMGSDTLVWTRLGTQALSVRMAAELAPSAGQALVIGFDPARASVFDAANGERL